MRTVWASNALLIAAFLAAAGGLAVASAPLSAQTVMSGEGGVGAKPGAFKGLSKNSDEPIDINSDKLTVYDKDKVAVFTGRVKAVQGDSTLTTTELRVYYKGSANPLGNGASNKVADAQGETVPPQSASGGEEDPQGPGSQLAKIEAKGNVDIQSADNQSAKGDHLLYDVDAGTVTLSGNVLITSDDNRTTKSDTAVYDMTKETVSVRGNVMLSKGVDKTKRAEKNDGKPQLGGGEQTARSDWAIYDVPGETVTVGGNVVLTQGQNVLKGNKLVINLRTGESTFENTGNARDNNRIRALFMPGEKGSGGKKKDGADAKDAPTSLIPQSN